MLEVGAWDQSGHGLAATATGNETGGWEFALQCEDLEDAEAWADSGWHVEGESVQSRAWGWAPEPALPCPGVDAMEPTYSGLPRVLEHEPWLSPPPPRSLEPPPPRTPIPPFPTTAEDVFSITELLETILACLPLEDIFVARRVCRRWAQCIRSSQLLMQRAFVRPWLRKLPATTRYQGLCTTPLLLNPLLAKCIRPPPSAREVSASYASFRRGAELLHTRFDSVTGGIHGDGGRSARSSTSFGLQENLLSTATALAPSEQTRDPSARSDRLTRASSQPILLDAEARPIHHDYTDEPIMLPHASQGLHCQTYNPGQDAWKQLLLTQPPIQDIIVSTPGTQLAIRYSRSTPIVLSDVLDALEYLKNEWPERWPRARDEQEIVEFEVALPLFRGGGVPAVHQNGNTIFRALKTKVRCVFAGSRIVDSGFVPASTVPWR